MSLGKLFLLKIIILTTMLISVILLAMNYLKTQDELSFSLSILIGIAIVFVRRLFNSMLDSKEEELRIRKEERIRIETREKHEKEKEKE